MLAWQLLSSLACNKPHVCLGVRQGWGGPRSKRGALPYPIAAMRTTHHAPRTTHASPGAALMALHSWRCTPGLCCVALRVHKTWLCRVTEGACDRWWRGHVCALSRQPCRSCVHDTVSSCCTMLRCCHFVSAVACAGSGPSVFFWLFCGLFGAAPTPTPNTHANTNTHTRAPQVYQRYHDDDPGIVYYPGNRSPYMLGAVSPTRPNADR